MDTEQPEPRGERALIRRIAHILGPAQGARVPFGDDMAAIAAGENLLWTVDTLMDGVDFESGRHTWHAIGRKAMAANLSDCAAMAVQPVSALCSVVLCNHLSQADALDLFRGAHDFGLRYGCPIVGGDTNSWDAPTVISITIAARALPDSPPVCRNGARPGDTLWVTGQLGGSILGRHMTFEPRIALAQEIARRLRPHAMMDISDGLALDLGRLVEASGCGAVIEETAAVALIHPDAARLGAQDGRPGLEHALHDGEDFELLVVLPPEAPTTNCQALGLLPLGQAVAEPGLFLVGPTGRRPIPQAGWEHFR
jgi:thiamine-monophosphate kinase